MPVDSSMRYSSGYTIITIRGSGRADIWLPETTGFHYTIVGAGGGGGTGTFDSTRGAGGGGGTFLQGWSTEGGHIAAVVGPGGLSDGDRSYIVDGVHEFLDYSYIAEGGKAGDSTQIGHGGACGNSSNLGGDPDDLSGGGGGGYSTMGYNPTSSESGGQGGEGQTITFFDFTLDCCGGGGGCGVGTTGGSASYGGGKGGYTLHEAVAGTDGYGGGGGGGYYISDPTSPGGSPSSTEIGILGYSSTDPIGGGDGFSLIYTSTDGDYIITTASSFASVLAGCTGGEIVFVMSSVTLDFSTYSAIEIPAAGITICSNRGLTSTDDGAILTKTTNVDGGWEESMLYSTYDNILISGIQMVGENTTQDHEGDGEQFFMVGIDMEGVSGFEVQNCNIYGWCWSGISITECNNAYIHHNYIHDNKARGEGYGTNLYGGSALFEANHYDYNRHSVTGAGLEGEQYEARFNLLGGHGMCIGQCDFDMHADEINHDRAGYYVSIHHNTVSTGVCAFAHVRHVTDNGFYVENNEIGSEATDTGTEDDVPIYQSIKSSEGYESLTKVYCANNVWLSTAYSTNAGITWFQEVP